VWLESPGVSETRNSPIEKTGVATNLLSKDPVNKDSVNKDSVSKDPVNNTDSDPRFEKSGDFWNSRGFYGVFEKFSENSAKAGLRL
jgi:hypothetical protein